MRGSVKYTISIIFLICLVQINFYIQRHEFATLFATYTVFFGAYIFVLKKAVTDKDITFFIVIGLILRGLTVFSFPNLSDDIYRFLWDGHLINLGENPFSHTPQYYADNQLFNDRLTLELFSKLNSAIYYSVYPSVCQSVFTLATFLFFYRNKATHANLFVPIVEVGRGIVGCIQGGFHSFLLYR